MFAEHARSTTAGGLWQASLSGLRDAWARRRVYSRTYAELNALSTRDLEDLGINRCMISRLAHEAAYGKAR